VKRQHVFECHSFPSLWIRLRTDVDAFNTSDILRLEAIKFVESQGNIPSVPPFPCEKLGDPRAYRKIRHNENIMLREIPVHRFIKKKAASF
ncbi:MAG: hypothetical protein ACFNUG_11405, partial [Tannerella forsythia]|uniref:hypothetical protein n=1 Tax=Tannerella forsythia TaxID=28112 RepID=UPI003621D1BB